MNKSACSDGRNRKGECRWKLKDLKLNLSFVSQEDNMPTGLNKKFLMMYTSFSKAVMLNCNQQKKRKQRTLT